MRFTAFLPPISRTDRACTLLLALGWAACSAGCSPRFDWRDAPLPDAGLMALMPCKPDRGERSVVLLGAPAVIRMVGCDAGGATFAIATTPVANTQQADAVQQQWLEATRRNILSTEKQSLTAPPFAPARGKPFTVSGADRSPAPILVTLHGQRPGAAGSPVTAQAVWFSRTQRGVIYVVQAVVYSSKPELDASETFFAGISAR